MFNTILKLTKSYFQKGMAFCHTMHSYLNSTRIEYFMTVKLLAEQHLESLSLKGGCKGSSASTLVKMPHFWKSHVAALIYAIRCSYYGLRDCICPCFVILWFTWFPTMWHFDKCRHNELLSLDSPNNVQSVA